MNYLLKQRQTPRGSNVRSRRRLATMHIAVLAVLCVWHARGAVFLANRTITAETPAIGAQPAAALSDARTRRGTGLYVVQFAAGPAAQMYGQLAGAHARVLGYLPDQACLIEAAPGALIGITALRSVSGVYAYTADDRLAPALHQQFSRNKRRDPETGCERGTFGREAAVTATGSFDVAVSVISADDVPDICAEVAAQGGRIDGSEAVGAQVVVRARISGEGCRALARYAAVQFIEPAVYVFKTYNDVAVSRPLLNVTAAWNVDGLSGRGQVIGHCDTGLDTGSTNTLHPDFTNRVRAVYSFRTDGAWNDPDAHGTHTAGSLLGNGSASGGQFKGVAYEAELVHQSAYLQEGYLTLPANLYDLFVNPYAQGARVHVNAWGGSSSPGSYSVRAQQVDQFAWEHPEMLIVFAAGNDGLDANADGVVDIDGKVTPPGTAKNIITVGAAESVRAAGSGGYSGKTWGGAWENDFPVNPLHDDLISTPASGGRIGMAALATRGPCADGRIKPELVAPGTDIISCRSRASSSSLWGQYDAFYNFSGGSSMAAPLIAGSAALVRQHFAEQTTHTNPSAALIKAVLIASARSLWPGQYGYGTYREIPGTQPNNVEGWGMPEMSTACHYELFDDTNALPAGGQAVYAIACGAGEEVHAALVWTDKPATAGAGKALINDLDLCIITPDGATNFANGGSAPDRVNNVETCAVRPASMGTCSVMVQAYFVDGGASQRYALVVHRRAVAPAEQRVEGLRHTPPAVNPGVAALVAVDVVTNSSGLALAEVYYRANSGAWQAVTLAASASFETGGTLTGAIPGHAAGSAIEYFAAAQAHDSTLTVSETNRYLVEDAFVCVYAGAAPAPPYQTWATGFTTISAAFAYVSDGWRIDVTGGFYGAASLGAEGLLINKAVHLRAVEGPMHTALDGENVMRPVTMIARGAVVEGFTIWRGNPASALGGISGGGVYMLEGTLRRCIVRNNRAGEMTSRGGGVVARYNGLIDACSIYGNSAAGALAGYGGGAYLYGPVLLRSCAVYGNSAPYSASYGGGVYMAYGARISNCTVAGNQAVNTWGVHVDHGGGIHGSIVYGNGSSDLRETAGTADVTWTVLPTLRAGEGNTNAAPGFVNPDGSDYHLVSTSYCINGGTNADWMAGAYDADGNARVLGGVVDRGGYELGALRCSAKASARKGLTPLTVTFTGYVSGTNIAPVFYRWDLNDDGIWDVQAWDSNVVRFTYSTEGIYSVYLETTNTSGETSTFYMPTIITVYDSYTHHVAPNGAHLWPYTSWAKAATNAADALALAETGHTVLFSNGTHLISSTLNINYGIIITSAAGAAATILRGNGTRPLLVCNHASALVTGLAFERGNSGTLAGGATMYAGTLRDCIFRFNDGYAGGALLDNSARMYECEFAYNRNGTFAAAFMLKASALAERCTCYGNTSLIGTVYLRYGGTLRNTLIYNNVANEDGGGTYALTAAGQPVGIVENCTIYGNRAARGGGMFLRTNAIVRNTIAYHNTAADGADYFLYQTSAQGVDVRHTCTTPLLPGSGNTSGDPRLVSPTERLYGLTSNSPCINAGTNLAWMTGAQDLAGRARINGGVVDMGAYEYYPVPYLWLPSNTLVFPPAIVRTETAAGLTIQNLGDAVLTAIVSDVSAPFTAEAATVIVAAASAQTAPFRFAPPSVAHYTQEVWCSGGGRVQSAQLLGAGISALCVTNEFDFGLVPVDTLATAGVEVINLAPYTVTGDVQALSAPFSLLAGAPYIIPAGGTATMTFAFAPVLEQTYVQAITFSGGGDAQTTLRGTGVPEPLLCVWCAVLMAAWRRRAH